MSGKNDQFSAVFAAHGAAILAGAHGFVDVGRRDVPLQHFVRLRGEDAGGVRQLGEQGDIGVFLDGVQQGRGALSESQYARIGDIAAGGICLDMRSADVQQDMEEAAADAGVGDLTAF